MGKLVNDKNRKENENQLKNICVLNNNSMKYFVVIKILHKLNSSLEEEP